MQHKTSNPIQKHSIKRFQARTWIDSHVHGSIYYGKRKRLHTDLGEGARRNVMELKLLFLPDLSTHFLNKQRQLKPLLGVISKPKSFILQEHAQLPDLHKCARVACAQPPLYSSTGFPA